MLLTTPVFDPFATKQGVPVASAALPTGKLFPRKTTRAQVLYFVIFVPRMYGTLCGLSHVYIVPMETAGYLRVSDSPVTRRLVLFGVGSLLSGGLNSRDWQPGFAGYDRYDYHSAPRNIMARQRGPMMTTTSTPCVSSHMKPALMSQAWFDFQL